VVHPVRAELSDTPELSGPLRGRVARRVNLASRASRVKTPGDAQVSPPGHCDRA